MLLSKIIERIENIKLTRGDIEVISIGGRIGTNENPVDTIRYNTENNTLVFTNDLPF